jgi:hypothetical protein
MANEAMFAVGATQFVAPEAMRPIPADPADVPLPPAGYAPVRGVRMPHGVTTALYFVRPIPTEMTLATGLTFTLVYALASANNADLSGTPIMMDVAAVPLVSGSSHADESALAGSTPAEGTMSLPTVPGTIVLQELAAPAADLTGAGGTLAAGNLALIRVRRRGDDPGDLNIGDILFVEVCLRNT